MAVTRGPGSPSLFLNQSLVGQTPGLWVALRSPFPAATRKRPDKRPAENGEFFELLLRPSRPIYLPAFFARSAIRCACLAASAKWPAIAATAVAAPRLATSSTFSSPPLFRNF